jgi:leucyl aminopeptidase
LQSFLRNAPGSSSSSSSSSSSRAGGPAAVQTPWVHVDMMAFNRHARPGRPAGGEAQGMRAVCAWLKERYPLQKAFK